MSDFKKTKENFIYDWKQRRYNLSLFGKNSQSDWNIVLLFLALILVISAIGGFVNYIKINNEMNRETEEALFKSRKKEIEKIGTLVSELRAKHEEFNIEIQNKTN